VTAQNGPAATLLVPGLAEAIKSSIPIVALVQEVYKPTTTRNAYQESTFRMFQACAKWVRPSSNPIASKITLIWPCNAPVGGRALPYFSCG